MKIHTTTNYGQFKFVHGNRDYNQANLKRINDSVDDNGPLVFVLIVNERLEMIDGQHRFKVWSDRGLPIDYIIKQGYGLPQVHAFNQNTKNWGLNEFLASYIKLGKKDYETYGLFKDRYKFGHNECLGLLAAKNGYTSNMKFDQFRKGFFKIVDYSDAVDIAEKVYDFEPYYEGFRRRTFIFALSRIIRNINEYNHKQMLNKLSYQSAKLTDQSSVFDYLKVLEGIYNYKSRSAYVRFDLVN